MTGHEQLRLLADALVADRTVPSLAICVGSAGGVHTEIYAGMDEGRTVDGETVYALASLTKPLVATATLVAVEEGIVELDRPLADEIPGVAPAVTLRGCLAHLAGLPESLSPTALGVEPTAAWPVIAAALPSIAPVAPAGARRIYSNVGYALAAACVERASDMPFADYLTQAVLAPIDPDGLLLPLGARDAATVREPGLWEGGIRLFNDPWFRTTVLPWSGGFATAPAYGAFLCRLLESASGGARALLAPETTMELWQNQGGSVPGGVESFMTWPRADWGLGFDLRGEKERHWTGTALSPRAATHFGASGTLCIIEPDLDLAAVVLAPRGTYSGWMLRPGAWPDIVAALIDTPNG